MSGPLVHQVKHAARVEDLDTIVHPIDAKGLPNHSGLKAGATQKQPVVSSEDIIRISIARPPTDEPSRWLNAALCRRVTSEHGGTEEKQPNEEHSVRFMACLLLATSSRDQSRVAFK
jgi:hypothetical protein